MPLFSIIIVPANANPAWVTNLCNRIFWDGAMWVCWELSSVTRGNWETRCFSFAVSTACSWYTVLCTTRSWSCGPCALSNPGDLEALFALPGESSQRGEPGLLLQTRDAAAWSTSCRTACVTVSWGLAETQAARSRQVVHTVHTMCWFPNSPVLICLLLCH